MANGDIFAALRNLVVIGTYQGIWPAERPIDLWVHGLATALVASVADPKTFRSGRNFSAWIGLVPKQRTRRDDRPDAWNAHQFDALIEPAPILGQALDDAYHAGRQDIGRCGQ